MIFRSSWSLPVPPMCPTCGYNLTGQPANRCPECGNLFRWEKLHSNAHAAWCRLLFSRHANRDARAGLIAAAIVLAVVVAGNLLAQPVSRILLSVNVLPLFVLPVNLILLVQTLRSRRAHRMFPGNTYEKPRLLLGLGGFFVALFTLAVSAVLIALLNT